MPPSSPSSSSPGRAPPRGRPPSSTARPTSASRTARPPTASSATPSATRSWPCSTARSPASTPARCSAASRTTSRSAPTSMTRSALVGRPVDTFIFGVAPTSGMLSPDERALMLDAMSRGMGLVNGLHEFLTEDPEFVAVALANGVAIHDVRKPKAKKDLHMFSGRIAEVDCPRIAVLGTDSRHRQADHRHHPHPGPQRPGHQGRPGRHRPDRPHPGRPLRHRPRRHPVPVLLRRDGERRRRGLGGRAPRRDHHRGSGRAQPPGLPVLHVHPPRQPAPGRHPPARPRARPPRRLRRRAHAHPGERDQPARDLRRHQGHRAHHQPRGT